MKIIEAKRDTLLKPLQAVTGIVERRHTLPILSNVLLDGQRGRLQFIGTDLEIQVSTASEDEGDAADVAVTVAAKKLQDILRALPDNTAVHLEALDNRLLVRSGKSRFSLQTLPAGDFPKLAESAATAAPLRMPQRIFKKLLALVQYAMAQQDIRYYLNGLLLLLDDGAVRAIATDGHRLSYAAAAHDAAQGRHEVILPRKAVIELSKLLADSEDEMTIEMLQNQVRFSFSNIVLISKIVDGKFPDYTRVIPTQHEKHFAVDRALLLQTLQRAAILSNEKFRGVRLVLGENNLRVTCSNSEHEEAQEELEIEYSGEALDIGFNIGYLLDVLSNLDCAAVALSFADANSSCLITIPGNDDFKHVVMPMRI